MVAEHSRWLSRSTPWWWTAPSPCTGWAAAGSSWPTCRTPPACCQPPSAAATACSRVRCGCGVHTVLPAQGLARTLGVQNCPRKSCTPAAWIPGASGKLEVAPTVPQGARTAACGCGTRAAAAPWWRSSARAARGSRVWQPPALRPQRRAAPAAAQQTRRSRRQRPRTASSDCGTCERLPATGRRSVPCSCRTDSSTCRAGESHSRRDSTSCNTEVLCGHAGC